MNPKHISEVREYIEETKKRKDGSTVTERIPRRAVAPYNFVELPEQVVTVDPDSLPSGDRYHLDRKTGIIECTLTTESPLYIRCGMTTADFTKYSELPEKYSKPPKDATEQQKKQWEEEKKQWETARKTVLAPFFTYRSDLLPVLPGSSLRGMLRTLVEIVSFSKIDRVSDEHRLFFRAVASNKNKESWGKEYKEYVEPVEPEKVKAGYLKKDNQGWYIQPATTEKDKTFAWVRETSLSLPDFQQFNDNNYYPQYIPVSYERADIDQHDKAKPKRLFAHNVGLVEIHPTKKGVLVTSGNMKQKKDESSPRRNHCVVFAEDKNADRLQIDDTAIAHYRNALTDFQKTDPFDKDWGVLQEKENHPVFYCPPEKGKNIVGFFGQSPNFRIPYSPKGNGHATTVVDFIPEDLRKLASIDLADAIFGWVKQESEDEKLPKGFDKQRAGRVFLTDALYQSHQNGIWYEDKPFTPQILSGPKPSCFPHYLVQPSADKSELKHYASEPVTETVIRGHKLYWHKGDHRYFKVENPDDKPKKVIVSPKKVSDTQTTLIKPIKKGVTFKFDIHFENLSDVELGALLWVLSLSSDKSQQLATGKADEKYCFSLGMGKPLGMGAVKIDYNLHLSDRTARYSQLFNSNEWSQDEKEQDEVNQAEINCISEFEKYVLDRISENDYPTQHNREHLEHLKQIPRIEMLLATLRCDPPSESTYYMELESFKDRKVLPTPLDIRKIKDKRRFPTNSTPSPKTESKSKPKPQKKSDNPTKETENKVNLALQRGLKPAKPKPKPKP
ncbi:MAG TPA: TIGR03986 family CRISPR-associated RAMP protein [Flavobacterium sp.]|nr:TIGR03986 family CRISPR-associated RAMP protein [Flavobacterium sp.]